MRAADFEQPVRLAGRTLQLPCQRRDRPTDRPDPEFLDARYEQVRHAEPG